MRVLAGTVVAIVGVILAAGCGSSHTAAPTTNSGVSLSSPRAQQIALARSSSYLFSMFPATPGTKNCRIPEGGPLGVKPLHGFCRTSIHRGQTIEPSVVVSFSEHWLTGSPCPPGDHCYARLWLHHTWRVIEAEPMVTPTARLRVAATQQSGSTAPQFYR